MNAAGRVIFIGLMSIFGAIIVLSITAGFWVFAAFAVFFCALFAFSAPFVFAKRWEPPEPTSAPRPVRRRRG
jgi:hypothetical protein